MLQFDIIEDENGIILDTIGIILEGRAAIGPSRVVTAHEVSLVHSLC